MTKMAPIVKKMIIALEAIKKKIKKLVLKLILKYLIENHQIQVKMMMI